MLRKFIIKNLDQKILLRKQSRALRISKIQAKSSEQLVELNKATNSSNKTDFDKGEPRKQGLRRKKATFLDSDDNFKRKGISKYGYGRWTSILNDPSFKFHSSRKPCTLAVRAKKNMIMRQRTDFANFTIM